MKKYYFLIILALILGLVLTGCSLLSNVGQVPATGQKGIPLSTANLVALWHFDENSGTTAYDSTENNNDGTISGASLVDGKLGKALSFDGNDYVIVPDSLLLEPDKITVEAWVKSSGTPGSCKYIVSKYLPTRPGNYSSYGLYTGSSGGLRFYIGYTSSWVASPDAGVGVWDGTWHHVAGTYDGLAVKLYVDGEPVAGAGSTTSDIYYEGTGNLFIGAYTTASYCFSGTIDEVRIWDGALTADEIWYSYANEILHVDDDWAQWPGAYHTITEALDVAVPDDTIIVHEGTYLENVTIPPGKNGLQLIGTGGSDVTSITPTSGRALTLQGNLGVIDDIIIQGFTLKTGDANYAFIALSGTPNGTTYTTNIELEDIVVDGGTYGIGLNAVQGITLTDVHISNIKGGAQGALELTGVEDFTFTQGSIVENDIGVRLQPTGDGDVGEGYGPNGNIQIRYSSLTDNIIVAVENLDSETPIDATYNWWGHPGGPRRPAGNSGKISGPKAADQVSENVLYHPWLSGANSVSNIALNQTATASATYLSYTAIRAVDGNYNTSWIADGYPPQWIEIDLGKGSSVVGLRLLPDQTRAGLTTHVVMFSNDGGVIGYYTFTGVTEAKQWVEAWFDAPFRGVRTVRVTTEDATLPPLSWVAWFEIEVYGWQ